MASGGPAPADGAAGPAPAAGPEGSRKPRGRGILKSVSAADQGLVETPILTPHLEFRRVGEGRALLVSEAFNTLLRGRIHVDLLPLLDGRRSPEDLAAALAASHSRAAVRSALVALAARGYVVSGGYAMERRRAAYWSALGASPRWAEQRLREAPVAVHEEGTGLAERLTALGATLGGDDPALAVRVADDLLAGGHAARNRRHLDSGVPWLLVRAVGARPLFGPVFRPGGPCWSCLAYRLRGHQEVHNFLRNAAGDDGAFVPFLGGPGVADAVLGLAAGEIVKWLVLGERAPLDENAVALDVLRLDVSHHPTLRRPQCFDCGDEALFRPDRPPRPLRLGSSPKAVRNSGGVRAIPPEATLARYRHLVSPISGVVSWVERTTEETDPWLHVHWAGSNFALGAGNLTMLRRSLRSKSAGKGSTPKQSEASALCEAIERYSCAFHGDEIRRRARLSDFSGEGAAIHPNDVQLFSEHQLDHAAEINAREHPYNHVPGRLDPEAETSWSPVWSLTGDRPRFLPTSMLYAMSGANRRASDYRADSNGCAAGNTLEEAILQGFFELVERDAFAIWWFNRLRFPGVDLESFGDPYLAATDKTYARYGREAWVLDITSDFAIPVFVAVSRRADKEEEDIIYGVGAHADPQIAALRAVCEMNQFLNWVQGAERGGSGQIVDEPLCVAWWKNGRLRDHSYLAPAPGAPARGASDYAVPDTTDTREDVERYRQAVEAKGMEFLVLDHTRPDIGMPVARVIVPGMRHFWERFAPGRLYDVPVATGAREAPLAEPDLNRAPVII